MSNPDLTIFFSKEVDDWSNYLTTWFHNNSNENIVIAHEALENLIFPLSQSTVQHFTNSRVVLVIISPAFLDFLNQNFENLFKIGLLLRPKWTVAMLCGVQEEDISSFHRDALVSYDKWLHLTAKHRDSAMVNNMIIKVQNLLSTSREGERLLKPGFKLVPLKVQVGKGKVFIIFKKPIQEECKKVKVYLDVSTMKEVPAKQINPYNWQFLIPDTYMSHVRLLNVHVHHGDDLIGIRQIKCESKMGELSSILSSTDSPYEFMCTTLGMASRYDVDEYMAKTFKELMPPSGLPCQETKEPLKWKKSKDEIPTLLHFAARYGMSQLAKEIILCPFAQLACYIKNVKDLNPVQLASHYAHHDVASLLTEFQKSLNCSAEMTTAQDSNVKKESELDSSHDGYDLPPTNPVPVTHFEVTEVTSSTNKRASLKTSTSLNHEHIMAKSPSITPEKFVAEKRLSLDMRKHSDSFCSDKSQSDFLKSQSKLIEIIKSYKKGATLVEVERMQNEWKSNFQVSDVEAKQPLEVMRNMYAKAQKPNKLSKNKSTSFSELFQIFGSKLRRKDSIGSKSNLFLTRKKGTTDPCETDAVRPMSTLSTTSNTSSSSGSSFDAVSSASAGSDSGNHSDNCDDRNHYKCPSQAKTNFNCGDLRRDVFCTNHKPPAPPPRPSKTYIKPNTLPIHSENSCQRFALLQGFDLQCKPDHVFPDTRSMERKGSLSTHFNNPLGCYDIPSLSRERRCNSFSSTSSFFSMDNFNYDMVPPPLPLSPKPSHKILPLPDFNLKNINTQLYDVPSFLADYDFPKTNNEKNSVSVKDSQVIPTTPSKPKSIINCNCIASKNSSESAVVPNNLLHNIPHWNSNEISGSSKPHYCNIVPEYSDILDNVPDEIAPDPPIVTENMEEHYKIVRIPIPIEVPD